jgi:hypothetical protein
MLNPLRPTRTSLIAEKLGVTNEWLIMSNWTPELKETQGLIKLLEPSNNQEGQPFSASSNPIPIRALVITVCVFK